MSTMNNEQSLMSERMRECANARMRELLCWLIRETFIQR